MFPYVSAGPGDIKSCIARLGLGTTKLLLAAKLLAPFFIEGIVIAGRFSRSVFPVDHSGAEHSSDSHLRLRGWSRFLLSGED